MSTRRILGWFGWAVLAVVMTSRPVLAQKEDGESGEASSSSASGEATEGTSNPGELGGEGEAARPWADGVPEDRQKAATALFKEGNGLLKDSLFVRAAAKYREALKLWDHPAIHFNLALALLNMDQPLEVYESLEKAMRYGPTPLDMSTYERARNYKALVEKQLAFMEISCQEPGAKVSLDGKQIFVGPGTWSGIVRVGEHNIVATKPGYLQATETPILEPEERATFELKLFTPDEVTGYKRRWDTWKPWAVVISGAAVAGVGGLLQWRSDSNIAEFDRQVGLHIQENCPPGQQTECPPTPQSILDIRSRAELQQSVAIGAFIAGGVTVATGFVLVYVNRPQPYRIDVEQRADRVSVSPLLAPGVAGMNAVIRF